MAAHTRRKGQGEDVRRKIQTTMILNRLQKHIESEKGIMSMSQIKAAEILLRKNLPDLKASEIDLSVSGEITFKPETVVDPGD